MIQTKFSHMTPHASPTPLPISRSEVRHPPPVSSSLPDAFVDIGGSGSSVNPPGLRCLSRNCTASRLPWRSADTIEDRVSLSSPSFPLLSEGACGQGGRRGAAHKQQPPPPIKNLVLASTPHKDKQG